MITSEPVILPRQERSSFLQPLVMDLENAEEEEEEEEEEMEQHDDDDKEQEEEEEKEQEEEEGEEKEEEEVVEQDNSLGEMEQRMSSTPNGEQNCFATY